MGLFNNSDLERRLQAIETQLENVKNLVGMTRLSNAAREIKAEAMNDCCQALSDQNAALLEASEALSLRMDIQQERIDALTKILEEFGSNFYKDMAGTQESMLRLHDRIDETLSVFTTRTEDLKKAHVELRAQVQAITGLPKSSQN